MLYFRTKEKEKLKEFHEDPKTRAMAVYGRRRVGKTELVLDYLRETKDHSVVYFQCTSFDYETCLRDFQKVLQNLRSEDLLMTSFSSFRDVFLYLEQAASETLLVVIDEFPFLCRKRDDAVIEFQWIIDHALRHHKLVLLGSNQSFMKTQINDAQAPLYGRFDEMMEIRPFTFDEVHALFPDFAEAVTVYAMSGGVAQYVMQFQAGRSVKAAAGKLFFVRDGRLFQEAPNMLMQELRDVTTYISILRAIGDGEKESGQIAKQANLDPRGIFPYLNRLMELEILSVVKNPLSGKQRERRYRISDLLFRFHYTFIDPNVSMISTLGEAAMEHILDARFQEYLGFVYEDMIREHCFQYGLTGVLPFMPHTVAKWWGNVQENGTWKESEIDVVAYDDQNIVLGECKYRNKMIGEKEVTALQNKAQFVPVKNRRIYYMLASKKGFAAGLLENHPEIILIDPV